ncbi:hypothetical protein PoB_002817300 [Plakobranchus ocellatus]|uniref:MARVEL domain-containing protein n=1 Tax=Plakobranchus ocellatus TaxID=259542 RepID=A0AAV4A4P5_9GAST|nr:hypothetical protein PoB_002817300 [Plakobranchus ocellatus]
MEVLIEGFRPEQDDGTLVPIQGKSPSSMWAGGLVFIVPGLLMFIAALVQNKCMYVVSCIFALFALLALGFVVVVAGLGLIISIMAIGSISAQCVDTYEGCKCREFQDESSDYTSSSFTECHYFSTFVSLTVALLVLVIVSWCLLLAAFIMAIYYSCQSETSSSQGTVYAPVQQPMYAAGQDPMQYPPPGYVYQQQAHQQPMYLEAGSNQPYYDGPPSKV